MSLRSSLGALAPLLLTALVACDGATTPVAPVEDEPAVEPIEPSFASHPAATGIVAGAGRFDAGVDVAFAVGVVQFDEFRAFGAFRFSTVLGGETVDFAGVATCVTIDSDNDRAWIGGIVTRNRSTHPSFTQPIHDAGRDIWFRAVDYGHGRRASQADRTTFVGFEGSAGIITSLEYCETRPWPGPPTDPVDARTNALTSGNLKVLSR